LSFFIFSPLIFNIFSSSFNSILISFFSNPGTVASISYSFSYSLILNLGYPVELNSLILLLSGISNFGQKSLKKVSAAEMKSSFNNGNKGELNFVNFVVIFFLLFCYLLIN
jgi:hypothetical protein